MNFNKIFFMFIFFLMFYLSPFQTGAVRIGITWLWMSALCASITFPCQCITNDRGKNARGRVFLGQSYEE